MIDAQTDNTADVGELYEQHLDELESLQYLLVELTVEARNSLVKWIESLTARNEQDQNLAQLALERALESGTMELETAQTLLWIAENWAYSE